MNRLVDVDVDQVHLVGAPANRRPFAVIKGLTGKRPDPSGGNTVKITDLLKAVGLKPEGALEKVETEVTPDQFKALVKALGMNGESLIEAIGKEDVAKLLGVDLPKGDPKPKPIDKSGLTPEVKAYVEKLEKRTSELGDTIDEIVKARETDAATELGKRIEILKGKGLEFEKDAKPTELEVAAFEKAAGQIAQFRKDLGILEIKGSPEEGTGTVGDEVRKQVVKHLGHDPKDALEEAQARRVIYRANPGLLRAVTREERAARAS